MRWIMLGVRSVLMNVKFILMLLYVEIQSFANNKRDKDNFIGICCLYLE